MWNNMLNFKLLADTKPGNIPDPITQAFLDVSNECLHINCKKRCKITEASEHNIIIINCCVYTILKFSDTYYYYAGGGNLDSCDIAIDVSRVSLQT